MESTEANSSPENFIKKSVLAICAAGSDRSRYIADELNNRGYFATNAGVNHNYNYVTREDLVNVGNVVFSSIYEKKLFDKDKKLKSILDNNGIQIRVINITEQDKDLAHNTGDLTSLKKRIAEQLDAIGFKNLKTQR